MFFSAHLFWNATLFPILMWELYHSVYLGSPALVRLGDRDKALEWTRLALAMDPEDTGVLYNVACNFATLGQTDECLDCLNKAISAGGGSYKEWMDNDPSLDSVRDHPRFKQMLQRFEDQ